MAAKFTTVKKGYDPKEVDTYIEKLENVLKDYADKEASISKALVNAEVASRKILDETELEAKRIIEDAQNKANKLKEDTKTALRSEIETVEKMVAGERKALEEFCNEYDSIVKNYFTGSSFEITLPLREKLSLIENIMQDTNDSMFVDDNWEKSEGEHEDEADSTTQTDEDTGSAVDEQPAEEETNSAGISYDDYASDAEAIKALL